MRLFIAINFNEDVKNEIMKTISELKSGAVSGNFTRRENLHLTLVFIGETDRAEDIKNIIDNCVSQTGCFALTIENSGKFSRNGGDIYWAGLKKNTELTALVNNLSASLRTVGFKIENRAFKPHITLGRGVVLTEKADFSVSKTEMDVLNISLMKSERINGQLTYTELYKRELLH